MTDIHRKVSWTFSPITVLISNSEQPLPPDILKIFEMDQESTIHRIEANWLLDEPAGFLQLSQMTADGTAIDNELTLPISPAGQVRVTLVGRQYNMFALTQ